MNSQHLIDLEALLNLQHKVIPYYKKVKYLELMKMNKILQTEDFEDWKTVSTEKLIKLHHKAVDYRNAKNKEYIEARDREIEMQQELNNRFGILSEEKE